MNLDEGQRKKITEWIAQGLKLSEIQTRLADELGLRLTYMDVRFLVDDLKLTPKDIAPSKAASPILQGPPGAPPPRGPQASAAPRPAAPPEPGGVSLSVDQVARPNAIASGKVTFSDGNTAEWYFDQMGRLGLIPTQPGYRPPAPDLQEFQAALEMELARLGF
jgi:hypothetical protein